MNKLHLLFIICLITNNLVGQNCFKVNSIKKISSSTTGLTNSLDDGDYFGQSVRNFGDFDGDGIEDLIVGSQLDDDGGSNLGAVYILLLKNDGSIKSKQKISSTSGGFTGDLTTHNYFGSAVSKLKDIDGDGVNDLLVGHIYDNTGNSRAGAVWIIFLNSNGTVKSHQKIANGVGGFPSILNDGDNFGSDAVEAGDIDGDGTTDIIVGAPFDDDGGADKGAIYIINLKKDGTVKAYKKVSALTGGFSGNLSSGDAFGYSVASNVDFNNDGIKDILVGARASNDGGTDRGSAWILFLNSTGMVSSQTKISSTSGSFTGTLHDNDNFGSGVAIIGDINNDTYIDIVISAPYDDDGGLDKGAAWLILMDKNGKVKTQIKISATSQYSLKNKLDIGDLMGWRISTLNDLDGDGQKEIVVGAMRDDDGGTDRGAIYIMNLADTCNSSNVSKFSNDIDFKCTLYPIPANNIINIECKNGLDLISDIKIINLLGEEVINLSYACDLKSQQVIDVSNLASGIYYVKVYSDNMNYIEKITILR